MLSRTHSALNPVNYFVHFHTCHPDVKEPETYDGALSFSVTAQEFLTFPAVGEQLEVHYHDSKFEVDVRGVVQSREQDFRLVDGSATCYLTIVVLIDV